MADGNRTGKRRREEERRQRLGGKTAGGRQETTCWISVLSKASKELVLQVAQRGRAENFLPPAHSSCNATSSRSESTCPPSAPRQHLCTGGPSPPANHVRALPAPDPLRPAEVPKVRAISHTEGTLQTPGSPQHHSVLLGLPAYPTSQVRACGQSGLGLPAPQLQHLNCSHNNVPFACVHVCVHECMCVHECTCAHTCACARARVHICACVCARMCMSPLQRHQGKLPRKVMAAACPVDHCS